jgi:hypothetical protein
MSTESETLLEAQQALEFIRRWYLPVLVFMLICGGVIYVTSTIKGRARESQSRASDLASELHNVFASFAQTKEKKGEANQKEVPTTERVEEAIKMIDDVNYPYKGLAPLYRARVYELSGKQKEALEVLSEIPDWNSISREEGSERLTSELGALLKGRLQLGVTGTKVAEEKTAGLATLKSLAQSGAYVSVAAALSFARSVTSPEGRAEAKLILNELKLREPFQETLLASELSSLDGVS